MSFVTVDSCWEWTGHQGHNGYCQFVADGTRKVAHRWSYEHFVGPVPAGMDLDHTCHNRNCVNPDHLEPVTHRENLLRGSGFPGVNSRKTHCPKGHPLAAVPDRRGRRICPTCNRAKCAARRRRNAS